MVDELIRAGVNRPYPTFIPPSEGQHSYLSLNIIELNKDNFNTVKNNSKFLVVKFYRENCPHCRHLAPDYAKLADELAGTPDLKFGEVDCIESSNLCDIHRITGVPTLKIFFKNYTKVHEGPRDIESLKKWVEDLISNDGENMKKELPPVVLGPAKPLSDNITSLNPVTLSSALSKNSTDFWIVKYFIGKERKDGTFNKDFAKIADEMYLKENLKFGEVDCPVNGDLCNKKNITSIPSVKIYYKGL
jgi:thiol-disulfide isomerase/thioredoxin